MFALFVPKASVAVIFISKSELPGCPYLLEFAVSDVGYGTCNSD
jgi:hypothetical protein